MSTLNSPTETICQHMNTGPGASSGSVAFASVVSSARDEDLSNRTLARYAISQYTGL
jgi:hypothetical protein